MSERKIVSILFACSDNTEDFNKEIIYFTARGYQRHEETYIDKQGFLTQAMVKYEELEK